MRYEKLPYERIRQMRIDSDLTQQNIADRLNLRQSTYSHYEIGTSNYPIEVLIKLADFYGTSVDYLLELTDNPAPYQRKEK